MPDYSFQARARPAAVSSIRSILVHPGWARRGIARRIIELSHAETRDAEQVWTELTATRSGVAFYRARGYEETGRTASRLPGWLTSPAVRLRKRLEPPVPKLRTA